MKRNFISNLVFLLFLNLLIKPFYAFGIDVGVQNAVGVRDYGNYFILLNFSIIFQIVLDLGIENFTRREIARHHDQLNKYFSNILPLKLILGGIYILFCTVIGMVLGWHLNDFKLLLILLFNQFLASFILYFRANLGGLHMFRTDSIISVADRFVVVVICGILLLNPFTRSQFRIEWFVYSQTVAYLTGAIVAFFIVFSRARPIRFRFNIRYYASLLKRSLPYALLILLMATYLRIDSVLLGRMLPNGKELAGIYAQSFRIIEILSNYGYLFTIILLPVFARMIKKGESVEPITRLSVTLLFVPAILVTVGCIGYRYEIIDLLYNEHMETSAQVFGILIFSFPGICITYIFGTLLTANGSLLQLNKMAGFAVVINIVLNLILIRKFGVYGAACANMATQLFTSAYQIILAKNIFRFKTDFKFLARFMAFTVLIIALCILIRQTEIQWFYTFGIYVSAGILIAFLTGLLRVNYISRLAHSLLD